MTNDASEIRSIPFDARRAICCGICFALAAVVWLASAPAVSADLIEFLSGIEIEGKVVGKDDKYLRMKVVAAGRVAERKYSLSRIHAVTIGTKRYVLHEKGSTPRSRPKTEPGTGTQPSGGSTGSSSPRAGRTRREVETLIEQAGRTTPDWYDSAPLDYPKTLDLSWPKPPPKGWNSRRNVGQYIWDIINPNPRKWREGVHFMHYMLLVNKDDPKVAVRVMNELGRMYYGLLQDYPRAAFWWRKAQVDQRSDFPASTVHLAECYWRMGGKQMAVELMGKARPCVPLMKLWADMGETRKALDLAAAFVRSGYPDIGYFYAGDAYRVAQRYPQAIECYNKVLAVPAQGKPKGRIERNQNRARALLEAIRLYETLDLSRVPDGVYRSESLGYAGPVYVEVAVNDGRITSVNVTQHKEKQFYSAITETPKKIIQKQGVKGVDTTSGATITSEAIIHATAKALAAGMK